MHRQPSYVDHFLSQLTLVSITLITNSCHVLWAVSCLMSRKYNLPKFRVHLSTRHNSEAKSQCEKQNYND